MRVLATLAAMSALLVANPKPVSAGFVEYDFSAPGFHSPSGGILTGFVIFDESLRAPGFISAFDFSDWAFAWGSDFTYSPATDSFDPNFGSPVGLILLPDLSVGYSSFCISRDGNCALTAASHPVLGVSGTTPNISTFATTSPTMEIGGCCSGVWSEGTVLAVPEPPTLPLLSLCFAAIGFSVRRAARSAQLC